MKFEYKKLFITIESFLISRVAFPNFRCNAGATLVIPHAQYARHQTIHQRTHPS